jgi:hydrogenase expression/formation protein HypC
MCLATPVRIETILEGGRALASCGGTRLEINVSLLSDPKPGDRVIVHAGYAIETLTPEDAEEREALFRELADLTGGNGAE